MLIQSAPRILELGNEFYDTVPAARFPKAILRYRNDSAASQIGLELLTPEEWKKHFWEFAAFAGNLPEPLALRYHGHQFLHYNPDLGDGRGFLLAQFQAGSKLYDLGTKGSGQTPYSRQGDGRLTLKGAFREILATEMLESLGVNTSKTLSVFETGENLVRYDEPSPTRSAVLVRLNHSHIRIGTFQRLAHFQDAENMRRLTDYCVKYYDTEAFSNDENEKAFLFFRGCIARSAKLTAQWMVAGFVHGVLNSDNINITGESFDYGPYRFLPHYDPQFTAAYFDRQGLYAFGRQPITMIWNLRQLGLSLQLGSPSLPVEDLLEYFGDVFNEQVRVYFLKRLNLHSRDQASDEALMMHFYRFLESSKALHEQSFFDFFGGISEERLQRSPQRDLYQGEDFTALKTLLDSYQAEDLRKNQHSYFAGSKACSLLIDELEALWAPIAENDDWESFERKLKEIRSFRSLYF